MRHLLLGLVAACAITACDRDSESDVPPSLPAMQWDTVRLRLLTGQDTIPLRVEVARTPEQKTMGLMERRTLAPDAGMLFVYDSLQPANAGFWMYRTRIPLDIAFVDEAGVIRAVRSMVPCETTIPEGCPTYAPGVPYRYALEVNAGFLETRGVQAGDRVLLPE